MQETQVRSLGQEDSPGEGSGNPLQYSCLESLTDRAAWQATVQGLTHSRTRLNRLSCMLREEEVVTGGKTSRPLSQGTCSSLVRELC